MVLELAISNLSLNAKGAKAVVEEGGISILVNLAWSTSIFVAERATGALWNLSYSEDLKVALTSSSSNASPELQEKAAGALWGLSESEKYSIAVVQGGGVAALIALPRSDAENMHESAAGAILALAFCPTNAFRVMEEGGVCALGHLCSSSASKAARFFSAMALAYMYDGRMDEIVVDAGNSKSVDLDGHRRLAMKHLEAFVTTISCPRLFDAVVEPLGHELVVRITEYARIGELDQLKCSRDEIERFVAILQNPSPALKSCAAFVLFQFTIPGGRFAAEHMKLLRDVGAPQVLRLH